MSDVQRRLAKLETGADAASTAGCDACRGVKLFPVTYEGCKPMPGARPPLPASAERCAACGRDLVVKRIVVRRVGRVQRAYFDGSLVKTLAGGVGMEDL